MQKTLLIHELPQFDGENIRVRGWVSHKRESGKKLKFLVLRDGTGWLQCVLFLGQCEDKSFELFDHLAQETSVEVEGQVKIEPRSEGGVELQVRSISKIGDSIDFPISPKEHGIEFLMENRHLWLRSKRPWAALRIRSELSFAVHEFFRGENFIHFDAPILTPNSCEGTSTLFSTPYFDEKAYLTQSGQLYGEAGAFAFHKIYTFGPTFRAEKSKTRKHLTEFWMIEPEVAFAQMVDVMDLGERFVKSLTTAILSRCQKELKILERDQKELEKIASEPFERISYDRAVEILNESGMEFPWGEDFGAPHETKLGEYFGKPVWIFEMPAEMKAFYFKRKPGARGELALGCDLIAPNGYGEIIGGGQREDLHSELEKRIQEHSLSFEDFNWYMDLRKFGSIPHAGFGLGLERMVAWMTGVAHVRETIPFPRMMNTIRP